LFLNSLKEQSCGLCLGQILYLYWEDKVSPIQIASLMLRAYNS
jgi:hypothetical protein